MKKFVAYSAKIKLETKSMRGYILQYKEDVFTKSLALVVAVQCLTSILIGNKRI